MPKLNNISELAAFREEAKKSARARLETSTTIYIGMGTCGIAAGARETLEAIQKELTKRKIDAEVTTVGCIGMCVQEPLVDIQQAGRGHVLYANIRAEMVPQLIDEHLVKGQPVKQWVIGRLTVE